MRLTNGVRLVPEVKGQDTQDNRTKREFLAEWVRSVNSHGGFGSWVADASVAPDDLPDILERHCPHALEATPVA